MAWKGVITNSGSELLAQWTAGKTLTITRAAAGTGRVSEAAMLAQTALVSEKQTVSILSNKTTAQGQKLQLQVTPLATGYPLNQLGIWAKLDSGAARLIALFQTDTDAGVEIPSKTDVPDYVYTFYGLLEFTGSGGTLQVTIDASALVTAESMEAAIKAHNEDENAHEGIRQAITDKQDKITASGILRGDGKGGVTEQTFDTVPTENSDKLLTSGAVAAALAKKAGLGTDGKVPVSQLPVNTPGGVAGLGEDGKVGTGQLPINTPGGVAGIGTDGKVGTGQLPINTPGGVAGLGADGKMDTDQLPINVPNGIPTLGADGKLSADSLPQVGMTAQIVVTAPTGSTVTATLGTKVYTATESGGKWTFDVEDYGTYTIKAINTPGGVAGIGTDGKVGTGQLPINTPGGVAGLGADGKMDTDQLPINVPNGIPTLGADGKLSADSLPQVGMTAQIVVTAPTGSTVTATLGTKVYTATESGGKWTFDVEDYGTYTIKATKNGQTATDTVTVSVVQQYTATLSYFTATIHVSIDSGSTVTCTKGSKTQSKTASATGTVDFTVTESGTYTITATKNGETAEDTATITADGQTVNVKLAYRHIYGVVWDGTSTTVWSRTDEAASFVNPTPYRAGATSYGSPFDNLYPWSGMVRVTDAVAGELVAIPKFWYKWTKSGSGLKLQIADKETDGFHVSPAHADRGDGKGERDIVYIGRYHCNTNNYKSQSGVKPKANITRSTARTSIHNLGSNIWQSDIQMRMTIWMLYLVEFADWNSQKTIGKGCGNNSATENMGYTDSMPYHTGTTLASRDSYGLGTQYRYIEGPWDNVFDWGDGCYYNSNGLNIINTPSSFSDNSGGTAVGVPSSGWPSAFTVATVAGLEWVIYPTASGGSETTYSADYWNFNASSPCLCFGGNYNQNGSRGLFYVYYTNASNSYAHIGCRLQKLP